MTNSKRKKRICHIISGLDTGGAERNLYNLLNTEIGQQYEHMVISLKSEGTFGPKIRKLSFEVHSMSGNDGRKHPVQLLRVLRRFRPNLLQGWMYHGNIAAWGAKLFLPSDPAIAWNIRHCVYDICAEKPVMRQLIRLGSLLSRTPAAIIFNARTARDQHFKLGYAPEQAVVIPNGFDTDLFRPNKASRDIVRKQLRLSKDVFLIGHVGRLHPMKGHHAFLKVVIPLMESHSEIQVVMSGRGVTLDAIELIEKIPSALSGRIHFLGDHPDVPLLMNGLDLFVQSASSEAFPNVLGEAMASGLACVTTAAGDSADVLDGAGVVVPIDDHDALRAAVEQVYGDPVLRLKMGRLARERIIACYPSDVCEQNYHALYSKILGF